MRRRFLAVLLLVTVGLILGMLIALMLITVNMSSAAAQIVLLALVLFGLFAQVMLLTEFERLTRRNEQQHIRDEL